LQLKAIVSKTHNHNCQMKYYTEKLYREYTGLIVQQAVTGSEVDGLYIALTDRGREVNDFQWDGWPGVFDGNREYWMPGMIFIFA